MTATDIVPAENIAALEALDGPSAELAISGMLDQAHAWLAHLVAATAPAEDIANFKAYVSTIAEAARQKRVAAEIKHDADVLLRRSERSLGLAIREGQERGEIARRGGNNQRNSKNLVTPGSLPVAVVSFAPSHEIHGSGTQPGIYAMTDDVTDEQFEEALERAQAEENVSRANVVRKTQEVRGGFPSPKARWQKVQELADRGHTSSQIAELVGITQDGVRAGARQRGITIHADRVMGKRRRIDTNRILRETTTTLEGVVSGLALVAVDDIDDPEEAREWVDSLSQSLKALRRAVNQIKESIP